MQLIEQLIFYKKKYEERKLKLHWYDILSIYAVE